MVTLGGQLVELLGTMSGGGGRVARGLMSNKSNDEFSPAQVFRQDCVQLQKTNCYNKSGFPFPRALSRNEFQPVELFVTLS